MKRLIALLAWMLFALPAFAAADHLDGVLPLYPDDAAAVVAAKKQSDRHVLLYFGDQLN
jgi:hypothetical protein